MMMVFLIIISLVFLITTCFFLYKYIRLKKMVKSYNNIGTGRYGFYKYNNNNYSSYKAIVYVDEIDRYTDGYSKIKIHKIEPISIESYKKDSKEKAENDFVSPGS